MRRHQRDFSSDQRIFYLSIIAVLIGCMATVAAFCLLNLIHLFTNIFFFHTLSFAERSPAHHALGLWVIALPVVGSVIVALLARFGTDKIRGHGIPEAIEAILFGKSRMSAKVAILKPLSSGIVIGSGGPFGAEGPIIMTGGAIGSLIAQHFSLSSVERKTLLVAGATAGMTAVFGTPFAAVLLAVELLLFEWRPRSLVPVILACAIAGFTRPLLLEAGPLFPLHTEPVHLSSLGICIIAGLLSGALASAMSIALYKVEDMFATLPLHWMWWMVIGAVVVGIGGYLEPRALGVGYDVIADLLNHRIALSIALSLLLVKAIIWVVALGSGTSGGVLAPLLMLGAGLGTLISFILPGNDATLWPLVCMASVLAGVLGAPLTAAIFALGLTNDFNALLPLLLGTGVSYGFTVWAMPRSIMTEKIARRGRHIYREYGVDPMERTHVGDLMTTGIVTIAHDTTLTEVAFQYFGTQQLFRGYPVVTGDGRFKNFVDRDTLTLLQAQHPAQTYIGDCLNDAPSIALLSQTCRDVATQLAVHGVDRIAVVNNSEERRLTGLISRSDLVKTSLYFHEEEYQREKIINWTEKLRGRAASR